MASRNAFRSPARAFILASPILPAAPTLTLTSPDDTSEVYRDCLTGSITTVSTRPSSLRSRRSGLESLSTSIQSSTFGETNRIAQGETFSAVVNQSQNIPRIEEPDQTEETTSIVTSTDDYTSSAMSPYSPQTSVLLSPHSYSFRITSPISTPYEAGAYSMSLPSPSYLQQPPPEKRGESSIRHSSLSLSMGSSMPTAATRLSDNFMLDFSPSAFSLRPLESPGLSAKSFASQDMSISASSDISGIEQPERGRRILFSRWSSRSRSRIRTQNISSTSFQEDRSFPRAAENGVNSDLESVWSRGRRQERGQPTNKKSKTSIRRGFESLRRSRETSDMRRAAEDTVQSDRISRWATKVLSVRSKSKNKDVARAELPKDIISSFMLVPEIIKHLVRHRCEDITEDLDLGSATAFPISNGGFGDIYQMRLKDGSQVAIKTMRLEIDPTSSGQKYLKEAARELHTWAQCNHPNVLKLLGLAMFRDQIGMVSPWMHNGNLTQYLSRNPDADRCRICLEISEAVAYLHGSNIIHGDLKGPNVLVSSNGSPMLTDFGNAIMQDRTLLFTKNTIKTGISPRWTAPEILEATGLYTTKTDVYALGMTILETITANVPYFGKADIAVMYAVGVKKEIPERPEDKIPTNSEHGNKLWALLVSCWSHIPEDRPGATEVANTIRTITSKGLIETTRTSKSNVLKVGNGSLHDL